MTDEQAYESLCIGCCFEKQCHEDMNYCDKFLMAIEDDGFGEKIADGFRGGLNWFAGRCIDAGKALSAGGVGKVSRNGIR